MPVHMEQVAHAIARQVEQEHALEIDRKRVLLLRCGVAEEDLSKNGQVYLHVLSEVAELLALKDTKSSSYLMAMADLEDALDDAEKESKVLREAAEEGRRRSQELAREWKQLESIKQQLEDAVDEREKHGRVLTRTEEYSEKQRAYEDELSDSFSARSRLKMTALLYGSTDGLCVGVLLSQMRLHATLQELQVDELHKDKSSHQALSTLEQECEAIEAQNRALQDQLLPFHGLPLSKELAVAQLFEARAELQRLEDQFSSQIQQML